MPKPITRFSGRWRFLSNFAPSVMEYDGFVIPTAEHAFNLAKTDSFEESTWVAGAATPGEAKRRGRSVTLRPGWDEHLRYTVMDEVLRAKFTCRTERVVALLSTGDALLVEENTWHDTHWGACICTRCAGAGENHLGRMLMELREELRR